MDDHGALGADGDVEDSVVRSGADAVALVTGALDPVLAAYGFAAGQASWSDPVAGEDAPPVDGMVIYCRPLHDGAAGCEDVVVHLRALPTWNVLTVTDDDPRGHWSLDYDGAVALRDQLTDVIADVVRRVLPPGPEDPEASR